MLFKLTSAIAQFGCIPVIMLAVAGFHTLGTIMFGIQLGALLCQTVLAAEKFGGYIFYIGLLFELLLFAVFVTVIGLPLFLGAVGMVFIVAVLDMVFHIDLA